MKLAAALERFASLPDILVLGLPRGGVPVAYEIAMRSGAPLDVLIVRKVGVPSHPELAMGAIASGGIRIIDRRIMDALWLSQADFDAVARAEQRELERREKAFRDERAAIDVSGKTVFLVDDGLATGSSMAAAIDAVRSRNPGRIVAAVPIAPIETCEMLAARTDDMVCLQTPERMFSVGTWYEDFNQTTDAEVRDLLAAASRRRIGRDTPTARSGATRSS